MTNTKSTPVAVFAYNRPEHLAKTLEALSKCRRIEECIVYIHCDGSGNPEHEPFVEETRIVANKYAKINDWNVIERLDNLGCDRSIINVVTDLCNEYGEVIVIEDDVYVSPAFISFMLESLDHYKNISNIFQIAGFSYSNKRLSRSDAFFLPLTTSWGWATWSRAWKSFEINYVEALNSLNSMDFRQNFDLDGSYPFSQMLIDDISGLQNKWDIWWYFCVFRNHGLVLYPVSSLVFNIGFDSSGLHCGNENYNPLPIVKLENFKGRNGFTFPALIQTDSTAFNSYKQSINLTINKNNNSIIIKARELLKTLLIHFGVFDKVKRLYFRIILKKEN